MADDASAYQRLTRMEQPFSALLLKEFLRMNIGELLLFFRIVACPTDSSSVLKGEVNTLTIV